MADGYQAYLMGIVAGLFISLMIKVAVGGYIVPEWASWKRRFKETWSEKSGWKRRKIIRALKQMESAGLQSATFVKGDPLNKTSYWKYAKLEEDK